MNPLRERQRARRHIRETLTVMNELTDTVLCQLHEVRNGVDTRDGLSARRYDGSNRSGSSPGGPTSAVVMRKYKTEGPNDTGAGSWRLHGTERFVEDVDAVFAEIDELGGLARSVHRRVDRILHIAELIERGRISSLAGECQACGTDVAGTQVDPFRSGYCDACYRAWNRAGRPERQAFAVHRGESGDE